MRPAVRRLLSSGLVAACLFLCSASNAGNVVNTLDIVSDADIIASESSRIELSGAIVSGSALTEIWCELDGVEFVRFSSDADLVSIAASPIAPALDALRLTDGEYELNIYASNGHDTVLHSAVLHVAAAAVSDVPVMSCEDVPGGKLVTMTNSGEGELCYTGSDGTVLRSDTGEAELMVTQELWVEAWTETDEGRSVSAWLYVPARRLEAPALSVEQTPFGAAVIVEDGDGSGAELWCSVDGESFERCTGAMLVEEETTVYAYASRLGYADSPIVSVTVSPTVPEAPEVTARDSRVAVGGAAGFSWEALKDAADYEAVLLSDGEVVDRAEGLTGTAASFVLPEAGVYEIAVRARNSRGWSEYSGAVEVEAVDSVTVTFKDSFGNTIEIRKVPFGASTSYPAVPEYDGFSFVKWSSKCNGLTEDLTVTAVYSASVSKPGEPDKVMYAQQTTLSEQAPVMEGWTYEGSAQVTGPKVYAGYAPVPAAEGREITTTFEMNGSITTIYEYHGYMDEYGVRFASDPVSAASVYGGTWTEVTSGWLSDADAWEYNGRRYFTVQTKLVMPEMLAKYSFFDKQYVHRYSLTEYAVSDTEGYCLVSFVGADGSSLCEPQLVPYGGSAKAPEPPEIEGFAFDGWSVCLSVVRQDLVAAAQYVPAYPAATEVLPEQAERQESFTVSFADAYGNIVESQTVAWGRSADAPVLETADGVSFVRWATDLSWWNVQSDMTVQPVLAYSETAQAPTPNVPELNAATRSISLSAAEGAVILYTDDGSDPETCGMMYEVELPAEPVTAVAVEPYKAVSEPLKLEAAGRAEPEAPEFETPLSSVYRVTAKPGTELELRLEAGESVASELINVVCAGFSFEAEATDGRVVMGASDRNDIRLIWEDAAAGSVLSIRIRLGVDAAGGVYDIELNSRTQLDVRVLGSEPCLMGDADGDGVLTRADIAALERVLLTDNGRFTGRPEHLDMDIDGAVTSRDLLMLCDMIERLGDGT